MHFSERLNRIRTRISRPRRAMYVKLCNVTRLHANGSERHTTCSRTGQCNWEPDCKDLGYPADEKRLPNCGWEPLQLASTFFAAEMLTISGSPMVGSSRFKMKSAPYAGRRECSAGTPGSRMPRQWACMRRHLLIFLMLPRQRRNAEERAIRLCSTCFMMCTT